MTLECKIKLREQLIILYNKILENWICYNKLSTKELCSNLELNFYNGFSISNGFTIPNKLNQNINNCFNLIIESDNINWISIKIIPLINDLRWGNFYISLTNNIMNEPILIWSSNIKSNNIDDFTPNNPINNDISSNYLIEKEINEIFIWDTLYNMWNNHNKLNIIPHYEFYHVDLINKYIYFIKVSIKKWNCCNDVIGVYYKNELIKEITNFNGIEEFQFSLDNYDSNLILTFKSCDEFIDVTFNYEKELKNKLINFIEDYTNKQFIWYNQNSNWNKVNYFYTNDILINNDWIIQSNDLDCLYPNLSITSINVNKSVLSFPQQFYIILYNNQYYLTQILPTCEDLISYLNTQFNFNENNTNETIYLDLKNKIQNLDYLLIPLIKSSDECNIQILPQNINYELLDGHLKINDYQNLNEIQINYCNKIFTFQIQNNVCNQINSTINFEFNYNSLTIDDYLITINGTILKICCNEDINFNINDSNINFNYNKINIENYNFYNKENYNFRFELNNPELSFFNYPPILIELLNTCTPSINDIKLYTINLTKSNCQCLILDIWNIINPLLNDYWDLYGIYPNNINELNLDYQFELLNLQPQLYENKTNLITCEKIWYIINSCYKISFNKKHPYYESSILIDKLWITFEPLKDGLHFYEIIKSSSQIIINKSNELWNLQFSIFPLFIDELNRNMVLINSNEFINCNGLENCNNNECTDTCKCDENTYCTEVDEFNYEIINDSIIFNWSILNKLNTYPICNFKFNLFIDGELIVDNNIESFNLIHDYNSSFDYKATVQSICNNQVSNNKEININKEEDECTENINLKIINTGVDFIQIGWNNNQSDSWKLEYKKQIDSNYNEILNPISPYTINNLETNQTYEIKLTNLCNNINQSIIVNTDNIICTSIFDFNISQISFDSITITWNDTNSNDIWKLYWMEIDFGFNEIQNPSSPYILSGLISGTNYTIKLVNECNNIEEEIVITTNSQECPLISNIQFTNIDKNSLTITWQVIQQTA